MFLRPLYPLSVGSLGFYFIALHPLFQTASSAQPREGAQDARGCLSRRKRRLINCHGTLSKAVGERVLSSVCINPGGDTQGVKLGRVNLKGLECRRQSLV